MNRDASTSPDRAVSLNQRSWDERTPIHRRSAEYQRGFERLKAGGLTLAPPTDTEIGDITGLRVLHLQCHMGHDTLSLARRGAEATGLDFSANALEAARDFARQLGVSVRFVQGDAQRADEVLAGEQFDLVFASFGVFCWIPDIQRWFASAANLLKPGGSLYIADGHPTLDIFEDAAESPYGIDFHYGYFEKDPIEFGPGPTYADDGEGQAVPRTVEYLHALGDFVDATVASGMTVEYLHEFPGCFFQRHRTMVKAPDGTWDFPPPLKGKLPMVFSLRATKKVNQ